MSVDGVQFNPALAAALRCRIAGLKRAKAFVSYRESFNFARDLDAIVDSVQRELLDADPEAACSVLEAFIEADEATYDLHIMVRCELEQALLDPELSRRAGEALRDRLGAEEAAQFSAQMPLLIRGMFYEGWQPSQTPNHERDLARFILQIESHVADVRDYRGPEDIAAVFDLFNNR